jgi:hypothetical protein
VWLTIGVLTAMCAGCIADAAAVAAGPRRPSRRSACQRLRGKDLAPARNVKLAKRPNADSGRDLVGCVLPRGRVRTVASSADFYTTTEGFSLEQVAGATVLVATSSNSQYTSTSSLFVFDLRSGRSYSIAHDNEPLGSGPDPGSTRAIAAFVNTAGQAVADLSAADSGPPGGPPFSGEAKIVGFSSRGRTTTLDTGTGDQMPARSLRLKGRTASWTHGGQPRSAQLSG